MDRPLAAPCLKSYRYKGRHGYVMIGAKGFAEALHEATRSIGGRADPAELEEWDGQRYVPNMADR